MRVGRSCTTDQLIAVIETLVAERGAPAYLRCDIHDEWGHWDPLVVRADGVRMSVTGARLSSLRSD